MNHFLSISNVIINMDADGRYCINDLHRASGFEQSKRPKYWLKNKQTTELIAEITKGGITPLVVVHGGLSAGTYVVKELVYAYAMWISPKFNLGVIRAYDKVVQDEFDRRDGLQYRALRAELDYQQGFKEAGICGKGLRKWRDDGPVKLKLLETFRQAMQPVLFQGN